mgnify:CR=1 FL=1
MSRRLTLSPLALALAAAFAPAAAAEPVVELPAVEVVGNSPLAGIGIPRLQDRKSVV